MTEQTPDTWSASLAYLHHLLREPRAKWRPRECDIVESIQELHKLSVDPQPYNKSAQTPWQSAKQDFVISRRWRGPRLKRVIGEQDKKLQRSLDLLKFSDSDLMNKARQKIAEICESLLALLDSGVSLVAAWDDLEHAVRADTNSDYLKIARLRDILMSLSALRGYDLDSSGDWDQLAGVLADSPYDVINITQKISLDEFVPELPGTLPGADAGLPASTRMAIIHIWNLSHSLEDVQCGYSIRTAAWVNNASAFEISRLSP